MFYILLNDGQARDTLMAYLKANGVSAVFHFVPLHGSPMGRKLGYREGDLPITEDLAARLLRLPCYAEITEAQQMRVADLVARFFRREHAEGPAASACVPSLVNENVGGSPLC